MILFDVRIINNYRNDANSLKNVQELSLEKLFKLLVYGFKVLLIIF